MNEHVSPSNFPKNSHWTLRYACASCVSPFVSLISQRYSPRSPILDGLISRLPSGAKVLRWNISWRSVSGIPSLNHVTNDESGLFITQLKCAGSPSITVILIGGIRNNAPPSTVKWKKVPFPRVAGVRLGNKARHWYQPESDSLIAVRFIEAFPSPSDWSTRLIRPTYGSEEDKTPSYHEKMFWSCKS